ncbi:MAG: hypothetical protein ACI8WB_001052 [Phenylobacterium sp.]|jgi:hypothetical protein
MRWQHGDITYCSNVHAGESVADIKDNLTRFIQPVSEQRGLDQMVTGLWIGAVAASDLREAFALANFRLALETSGLVLTSINGFPYGGFHQDEVKAKVYLPDWSDPARLRYTKDLAAILAACLPDGYDNGSISTLPLGYKRDWDEDKQRAAVGHLGELMIYLTKLKLRTGKHISICLEMEPDCVLESTTELIEFFTTVVKPQMMYVDHLAVCYDVCHQAVMHEEAYAALKAIHDAGITIGKIQLSSALSADFNGSNDDEILTLLAQFSEPKYLHQVKTLDEQGGLTSSDDLSTALAEGSDPEKRLSCQNDWRIHFHVPIHAQSLIHPQLRTTRAEILRVFDFLRDHPDIKPWLEVETYSWQVLPQTLRPQNDSELISGIVEELRWVEAELANRELIDGQ